MGNMSRDAVRETTDKQFHSCGVWPLASYINHSCNSNARRAFIGDMMIVRATRDLAPDEEINFWYHTPSWKKMMTAKRNSGTGDSDVTAPCVKMIRPRIRRSSTAESNKERRFSDFSKWVGKQICLRLKAFSWRWRASTVSQLPQCLVFISGTSIFAWGRFICSEKIRLRQSTRH